MADYPRRLPSWADAGDGKTALFSLAHGLGHHARMVDEQLNDRAQCAVLERDDRNISSSDAEIDR
jgi:hypothetical protein